MKNIFDLNERLYYGDPYKREFESEVISSEPLENGKHSVRLVRTAFYPEGGGQPADTGNLCDAKVLYVCEKNGTIYHHVDRAFEPGVTVSGRIDFGRRFSNMQNHSGEHIVSGLIKNRYGFDNVGFHMGSEFITIDFNGELSDSMLAEIEILANETVYQNIGIEVLFPSGNELKDITYRSKKELLGVVRIVHIPGNDTCACCGTHVLKTGEIGLIKLISHQKYKGGTRVHMLSGRRALDDYREKNKNIYKISFLMSSKPNEVSVFTENILNEYSNLKYKLLQQKLLRFRCVADSYEPCDRIVLFEDELSPNELKQFSLMLCEKADYAAVLSAQEGTETYKYAVASVNSDAMIIAKQLNQLFGGRGGGSKELAQGSITGSKCEIDSFLRQVDDGKKIGNC